MIDCSDCLFLLNCIKSEVSISSLVHDILGSVRMIMWSTLFCCHWTFRIAVSRSLWSVGIPFSYIVVFASWVELFRQGRSFFLGKEEKKLTWWPLIAKEEDSCRKLPGLVAAMYLNFYILRSPVRLLCHSRISAWSFPPTTASQSPSTTHRLTISISLDPASKGAVFCRVILVLGLIWGPTVCSTWIEWLAPRSLINAASFKLLFPFRCAFFKLVVCLVTIVLWVSSRYGISLPYVYRCIVDPSNGEGGFFIQS